MERTHGGRTLLAAFCGVAALFWLVTIAGQLRFARIDGLASDLAQDSAPSVRHLASARSMLGDLGRLVLDAESKPTTTGDLATAMRKADADMRRELDEYRALPLSAEERPLWASVNDKCSAVSHTISLMLDASDPAAQKTIGTKLRPSIRSCSNAMLEAIDFNGSHIGAVATDIQRTRATGLRWTMVFLVSSSVLTLLAAWLAVRTVRQQSELVAKQREIERARAYELELFGARLAHDVRGALSVTSMSVERLARRADLAKEDHATIERAQRGLRRVQTIVDGLYEFAAAGAKPTNGASCAVDAAISDVVASIAAQARQASIEIVTPPPCGAFVAAHEGVLSSILSNLLTNAVKYAGGRPGATAWIRARADGALVRIEVEDDGPGVPSGMEHRIFDPYERGAEGARPGIGIGLATVRRLVEGHGGRVSVETTKRGGALFWFELPRASEVSDSSREGVPISVRATS